MKIFLKFFRVEILSKFIFEKYSQEKFKIFHDW